MIVALLHGLLAIGPCEPVVRASPDPGLAAVYAKVAREEESHRAFEAAAAAWRSAASLDRTGSEADQALQRLCGQDQAARAFDEGLEHFKRNECPAALVSFQAARGSARLPAALLLEGICRFSMGEDAPAIAALTEARADASIQPTADLYLGLIALRAGDRKGAALTFGSLAKGPNDGLRSIASDLLAITARPERWVIDGSLEGGYDSNATLKPFATVLPGGDDDGFGSAAVNVTFRPFEANGPFVSVGGGYRKYLRVQAADVGLATATLGWQLALNRVLASLDYGADLIGLGAMPWLVRQRGTVRGLLALEPFVVSAEYVLGYDLPLALQAQGYRGFRHLGRVAAALQLGAVTLELSAPALRLQAALAERSSVEAGAELDCLIQLGPWWALWIGGGARGRLFDGVDPDFGVTRRELQLDGQVTIDRILGEGLSLFALIEARKVFSSVEALSFTRLSASAGLRLSLGIR